MKWLEGFLHKHTIICIVIAAAVLLGWYKFVAHEDGIAHDQRVLAEAQLKTDQKAQLAASVQAQKDQQAYSVLKQQMDSQNAQLRSQITALSIALGAQRDKDSKMAPPELAERQISLVGALPGDIKAVPDGLLVNLDASHKTVSMLEEVPALRQTVQNQDKLIANDKSELASIQTALTSSQVAETACKTTQVSQAAACEAEKKEIKAKARKHSFWFALGSFIGGVFLGHRL